MLSSLGILQHYVDFYTRTIAMLEKLFSARSFDGLIDHLACYQTTFLVSLSGFGLPFVVRIVTLALLGLGINRSCTCHLFPIG